jgi:hypothetical protein
MKPGVLGAVLVVAMTACGTPGDTARDDAETAAHDAIPEDVQQRVANTGAGAAQALRAGLSQRLTAAIAEGGPEAAIDVCAVEAMPLTDSIAARSAAGVSVKRTARRLRNPDNAPDAEELAALEWFEDREGDGERPTSYIQKVGDGYRYYEPLRVAPLCLHCHGQPETLSAPVRAALTQRYPADRATGYVEGDLRGLIRVEIPDANAPPH